MINRIQNKSFCLHNIMCVCTVYIYVYINTHTYNIYLENMYIYLHVYIYIHKMKLICMLVVLIGVSTWLQFVVVTNLSGQRCSLHGWIPVFTVQGRWQYTIQYLYNTYTYTIQRCVYTMQSTNSEYGSPDLAVCHVTFTILCKQKRFFLVAINHLTAPIKMLTVSRFWPTNICHSINIANI